jgi:hypothetical protein
MAYDADQHSLLQLRQIVQRDGPSIYLEIGSEAGRSLLPALIDPQCQAVHSVDLRPASTPDERGSTWNYGVTTQQMRDWLRPQVTADAMFKLHTYETDSAGFAEYINNQPSFEPPNIVFLDAEHTNAAVFQDFLNMIDFLPNDAIFAGHDSNLIFDALTNIKAWLTYDCRDFYMAYLPDVVFAFAFGKYIEPVKQLPSWDPAEFVRYARQTLNDEITMNAPSRPRIPNIGVLRVPTL